MDDVARAEAFALAEECKASTLIEQIRQEFAALDRAREDRATWERGENE